MKKEIQWHKIKLEEEMDKLSQEVKCLEYALQDKCDPTKLVETRLENRSFRLSYIIFLKIY